MDKFIRLKNLSNGDEVLSDYLQGKVPLEVGLPFGHGLGDLVMFIEPYRALIASFPHVKFTLILQAGLGFEQLRTDIPGNVVYSSDLSYDNDDEDYGYDIIADIDFPMNEGQVQYTKGQFCCVHELGIDPALPNVYSKLNSGKNRLILVQFHITCLPDSCNPDADTAARIWNDILQAGYIPLEMHFQHVFHNPVNEKFPFITSTVRQCRPQISSLIGLIDNAAGVVSVVTGNLHVALANMDPRRIFFLEKDFKLESFIKNDLISRADLRNYKGEVSDWLSKLDSMS